MKYFLCGLIGYSLGFGIAYLYRQNQFQKGKLEGAALARQRLAHDYKRKNFPVRVNKNMTIRRARINRNRI